MAIELLLISINLNAMTNELYYDETRTYFSGFTIVLSANVDWFISHNHFLCWCFAPLLLLGIPHEHEKSVKINAKYYPRQVETVTKSTIKKERKQLNKSQQFL